MAQYFIHGSLKKTNSVFHKPMINARIWHIPTQSICTVSLNKVNVELVNSKSNLSKLKDNGTVMFKQLIIATFIIALTTIYSCIYWQRIRFSNATNTQNSSVPPKYGNTGYDEYYTFRVGFADGFLLGHWSVCVRGICVCYESGWCVIDDCVIIVWLFVTKVFFWVY